MTRALVVLLLCAAAVAHADGDDRAKARTLATSGQRHFDLGEYDAAIADYRDAYRLDPRPGLLYNLGQAYRLRGDCVTASAMYRNFLRLDATSKYRDVAQQHLGEIADCEREQLAGGANVASAEGAEENAGPTAPDVPVVDAPAPKPIDVVVLQPERRPPRPSPLVRIGLVTGIAGLGLSMAGTWFAVDASRADTQVSALYAQGSSWDEVGPIDARGRRSALLGKVGFAVGGVAIATGVVLWILGRHEGKAAWTF